VFSLYTRWFHKWALLVGWAAGMVYGTVKAYQVINPATGKHFGGSLAAIPTLGDLGYIALTAFVLNVVVAVVLTVVLTLAKVGNGIDQTVSTDYFADHGDPRVDQDLREHAGPRTGAIEY
jgi:SSS family solute:Na+ symporter